VLTRLVQAGGADAAMSARRQIRSLLGIRKHIAAQSSRAAPHKRDSVLTISAVLMIIFGIAEVVAGFGHTFFGVHPAPIATATYLGAGMGALHFLAGLLILTARQAAATLALCLLAGVILGHVAMVVTDLYPTDSISQPFAIVLRTSIACAFFVVVALKWGTFV
jgi:uncharacterized membrane protein